MSWDYIAGFIDGEGSIIKRKHGYNIIITQTNLAVLEEIRNFIGKGYVYTLTKRKPHWKDAWLYSAGSSKNSYYILRYVTGRLIVKKALALKVLDNLRKRFLKIAEKNKVRNERIRKAKLLRRRGWSYRKIGKVLSTDWGYIRRLVLFS